jgi:hypothetical protein
MSLLGLGLLHLQREAAKKKFGVACRERNFEKVRDRNSSRDPELFIIHYKHINRHFFGRDWDFWERD